MNQVLYMVDVPSATLVASPRRYRSQVDLLALNEAYAGASPTWMDWYQPLGLSLGFASDDAISGSETISIV